MVEMERDIIKSEQSTEAMVNRGQLVYDHDLPLVRPGELQESQFPGGRQRRGSARTSANSKQNSKGD